MQSTARLTQLLESNKLMCDIAQPFMDRISQNIPGPSSVVSLLDHNGYPLLRVASDENPEYDKYLQTHGLLPWRLPQKRPAPRFPGNFLVQKNAAAGLLLRGRKLFCLFKGLDVRRSSDPQRQRNASGDPLYF